jgi:hypothetical protein
VDARIQVVAIVVASGLLLGILELVRQRRLLERYAIVWLLAAIVLLALAVWRDLLTDLASLIGIAYPPNALFFVAFGAILLLLLHFSIAVSRLHDQSKVLAQRVALLEEQMRHVEPESEQRARDTIASASK